DGIRDFHVTGVQTCALPIWAYSPRATGPHLALWHGVNTPLLMSLAVIGVGIVLYRSSDAFIRLLHTVPGRINVNAVYDWSVDAQIGRASCREGVNVTGCA